MIDINSLRENPDFFKKATQYKQMDPSVVDQVLELDKSYREILRKVEDLRAERNKVAKERNIERGKEIKEELKNLETSLKESEENLEKVIHNIPNPAFENVPVGKGESGNKELRIVGEIPKFTFEPKDHLALGEKLGVIDFENGAKVSGSQFYYLKGDLVMLEFALIQYGLEKLTQKGYLPVTTPDLARSRYYLGTGYNPKGDEAQIYEINGEDLGLIATAEVTMAGLHADEVLDLKSPIRYAAISHCFRQEAGAYGKYSKGLYRVHQFTKLEMFIYCSKDDSEAMHQELLSVEEEIFQGLNIPYRVLEMCTGDLGAIAAKKYDLEAWMPGRNDWGEITSTSNTTDYQSRNLNIRYRAGGGQPHAHLLNGTAIAISRAIISIMENYQNEDGTIRVPEVLQKYIGKDLLTSI